MEIIKINTNDDETYEAVLTHTLSVGKASIRNI